VSECCRVMSGAKPRGAIAKKRKSQWCSARAEEFRKKRKWPVTEICSTSTAVVFGPCSMTARRRTHSSIGWMSGFRRGGIWCGVHGRAATCTGRKRRGPSPGAGAGEHGVVQMALETYGIVRILVLYSCTCTAVYRECLVNTFLAQKCSVCPCQSVL
jgi:hypothetical protein